MSLNENLKKLKEKETLLKEFTEDTPVNQNPSRVNRARMLRDEITVLKFQIKESYLTSSYPILVSTKASERENIIKRLGKLGVFCVDTYDMPQRIAHRIKRGLSLERGLRTDNANLIAQELREGMVDSGLDGREIPYSLTFKGQRSLKDENELVEDIYTLLENSYVEAQKNIQKGLFTYSSRHLVTQLTSYDTVPTKAKVMVILVPTADQRWSSYVQNLTNKPVMKVNNSDPEVIAANIKKLVKTDSVE